MELKGLFYKTSVDSESLCLCGEGFCRGAVLFEAVIAIAILSVAITLIMQGFMSSMKAVKASEDYVTHTRRLEEKMWEIEDEAMKGILTTGSLSGTFDDGIRWEADISDVDYEDMEQLKSVRLSVEDKTLMTYVIVE